MAGVEVESEVTGTLWKLQAQVGTQVAAGDVIMILESMKMEIPVEAPSAGTVTAVHVAPEDKVDEGAVLVELDAS